MVSKINADTSDGLKITSDTSGTLDIQSGGTTKMTVGSTIDLQGNELVLDADADSSIHADTDDQVDFKVAGADCMKINSSGNLVMATGKNLCIGDDDDVVLGRATDNRMTFNTNGTESARIDENQDLMVGTAVNINSSGGPFHVKSRNGSEHVASFQNGTSDGGFGINFYNTSGSEVGSIRWTASATNFNTSSDYRLKENVDYSFDATERLKQLKPCRFNWISDDTNTLLDGFLAHEVSSIVPEAVMGTKDGTKTQDTFNDNGDVTGSETVPDYQSVDQSKLVPLLVKTIQELEARITALESE